MGKSTIHGTTVEGGDGVTRHVDAGGNVGDPIHEVTTDASVDDTATTDSTSTTAPAKKAPAKAASK